MPAVTSPPQEAQAPRYGYGRAVCAPATGAWASLSWRCWTRPWPGAPRPTGMPARWL